MKPLRKTAYLLFIILLSYSCAVRQQEPVYTQEGSVDFQLFYDQLSPYGQWVDYSNYGYVWIPDVRRDFAPYSTNGHWVLTDYGWAWASDYRWGWAPFHYGRWDFNDYYGWFWVPDNEWGPSWVTWRSGNGYYGWAPMRPGMSINTSFNEGYRDINRWNFVRDRDFGRRDIHRYYVSRGNYNSILNNSTVINNTSVDKRRNATYVAGPPEDNVQRATGRNINRVRIQDNERPGERLANDELKIYRPRVQRTSEKKAAPTKVADLQEVKPLRERGTSNQRNNVTPIENQRNQQQNQSEQQIERRRTGRQQRQLQQTEKSQQIPQTQPQQPKTDQQPLPSEQRNMRRQRQQQIERQNQQMQQNQPGQTQQQVTPIPPQTERSRIQQAQIEKQDRTKQEQQRKQQQQQVQRQQQQVERQQQQIERQQQQQQRRQERQLIRQQQTEKSQPIPQVQPTQQQEQNEQEQKTTSPSGSRRR